MSANVSVVIVQGAANNLDNFATTQIDAGTEHVRRIAVDGQCGSRIRSGPSLFNQPVRDVWIHGSQQEMRPEFLQTDQKCASTCENLRGDSPAFSKDRFE